jgi:precorrin-2 dehydrogenase/sirohydrochlorin ferrochelatase
MYPVTLDVRGRLCVVVGGGNVAARKVESLLEAGARVRLVAPELCAALEGLAADGTIEHRKRPYAPEDLDGAFLAISATDDRATNEQVSRDATARGLLVNVVDVPELCTFQVPASIRRGSLLITISTGGKSPALSRRIREQLDATFGEEYAAFLDLLGELRRHVMNSIASQSERQRVWEAILDSDAVALIREGRADEARRLMAGIVEADAER